MDILKLLEFYEHYSIETSAYFQVSYGLRGQNQLEILWCKDKFPSGWSYRLLGKGSDWIKVASSKDLLKILKNHDATMDELDKQISSNLLTQVSFVHMFLKSAEELFGAKRIEESLQAHESFKLELLNAIESLLGASGTDNSKLQKQTAPSQGLRLVKK